MNGPPRREEAAEVLTAPSTAQREAESSDIVDDEADERKRFAELQERATKRGYTLRATGSGYILQRGAVSIHTADLMTVSHELARRTEPRK